MKDKTKRTRIIISTVILALLIWGLIESAQSSEVGLTCDVDTGKDGSVFCWKWHQNTIGEIANKMGDFFNK